MLDISERPTRAPAPARQQLYAEDKFAEIGPLVDACLPKNEAGNFIAERERSDVVHDSPGLPGGKNGGDEQTKAAGDQRLPGLAGELPGRKGVGPHAQDQIAELLR
jgi:hypothetical protein